MWPSVLIICVYASFMIDFWFMPIPSEASTVALIGDETKRPLWQKVGWGVVFIISLLIYLTPLGLAIAQLAFDFVSLQLTPLFLISFLVAMLGRVISLWGSTVLTWKQTDMVTHSIFSQSRNPIALGMHITLFGLLLCYYDWWILWLGFIFYVVNLHTKIVIEEQHLIARFGTIYQEYMQKTPRYLWR